MQFRGGMSELMRQASRLQRKIEKTKQELKEKEIESETDPRVKAIANGGRQLVRVTIDPELLKTEELSLIEDMIVAAANSALGKANTMVDEELEKVTGGLKVPGLY